MPLFLESHALNIFRFLHWKSHVTMTIIGSLIIDIIIDVVAVINKKRVFNTFEYKFHGPQVIIRISKKSTQVMRRANVTISCS